jgi:hypothetical protein
LLRFQTIALSNADPAGDASALQEQALCLAPEKVRVPATALKNPESVIGILQ